MSGSKMSEPSKGRPRRPSQHGVARQRAAAAGSDDYNVRPFRPEDLPEVLALFQESYGKSLDERFYRWRFLENPNGPAMILLAIAGEQVVSHYAVCPAFSRDPSGGAVRTAQSMTTMTHPDHTGRGLFTRLAGELYERIAADHGVEIVFGFPNANSHYGFREKLGWADIHIMSFLTRDVGNCPERDFRTVCWEASGDFLDAQIATLEGWQPYRRDREFLRWRYEKCPTVEYTAVAPEETRLPVALVVKEHEVSGGARELDIVDVLGDHSPGALLAVVDAAVAFAASRGLVQITTWIDLFHPLWQVLESRRFRPSGPITYFGARALARKWDAAFDPRAWRITMGDSDVF